MTRSRKLMGAIAAVILLPAAFSAAGCGGSSKSSTAGSSGTPKAAPTTTTGTVPPAATPATPPQTSGGSATAVTQTVSVNADPTGKLAFVEKALTAKAGPITFAFHNQSSVPHNLAITGGGATFGPSETISGGQTADLVATLKAGTYQFFCAVPGHKDAGMQGRLTVT